MSLREKIYKIFSLKNKSNYGFYQGSIIYWNQIVWNIIFPGRIINRIKGYTLFNKKFNKKYYNFSNDRDENFWRYIFKKFNDDGCVLIENYFSNEIIERFKKDYEQNFKFLKEESNLKTVSSSTLKLSNVLMELWLDPNLIGLMKKFYI